MCTVGGWPPRIDPDPDPDLTRSFMMTPVLTLKGMKPRERFKSDEIKMLKQQPQQRKEIKSGDARRGQSNDGGLTTAVQPSPGTRGSKGGSRRYFYPPYRHHA